MTTSASIEGPWVIKKKGKFLPATSFNQPLVESQVDDYETRRFVAMVLSDSIVFDHIPDGLLVSNCVDSGSVLDCLYNLRPGHHLPKFQVLD